MSNKTATTRRITITIPDYLEERLRKQVPSGQVSSFVSTAIEEKITSISAKLNEDPLEAMMSAAALLPPMSRTQIQHAIDKGRP